MKSQLVSKLAVIIFTLSSVQAFGADKKAEREPASNFPESCLKVVQSVTSAATKIVLDTPEKDVSVDRIAVTERGEIPPADGVTNLEYVGVISVQKQPVGTFTVRMTRGGCILNSLAKSN